MPRVPCLKVRKQLGEQAIATANRLNLLNRRFKVQRVGDFILVPLVGDLSNRELGRLKKKLEEFEVSTFNLEPVERRPTTLMSALEGKLPPYLLASLPRSMDIIGDVAVVELPPELEEHKKLIGNGVLAIHKNLNTVLAKSSAIGGPHRTREFEVIAGLGRTETLHREHGCSYRLDVAKVYFSPRLAYEHERVARQVKDGEMVLDMFAGVGPFSILIAKMHRAKIYAIDINPDAVRYLQQNMVLNRVQDRIVAMQGDARAIVKKELSGIFDRVIMNLPAEAISYVDVACMAIKPEGGVIHYYEFVAEPNPLKKAERRFSGAVKEAGRTVEKISVARLVKPTAPREWQVAVDAFIR